MLKKLASLFLSLLLCLSLLPGQAKAAGLPDSSDPPAQTEMEETESVNTPSTRAADFPEKGITDLSDD